MRKGKRHQPENCKLQQSNGNVKPSVQTEFGSDTNTN